jgi:cell division protein FtsX
VDVSHCGAGCSLGDVIAEFAVFGIGATIAGTALYAEYIGDYIGAVALGVYFPDEHLHPDSAAYWFLMQIGMIAGFFTAWPADVWLIRRGVKEPM